MTATIAEVLGILRDPSADSEALTEAVFLASELLCKADSPGLAAVSELDDVEPTDDEYVALRTALLGLLERGEIGSTYRSALVALSRVGDTDQERLRRQAHLLLQIIRTGATELLQVLLALEDSGEQVYPEMGNRSIDHIDENVAAAAAYLRRLGTIVPL